MSRNIILTQCSPYQWDPAPTLKVMLMFFFFLYLANSSFMVTFLQSCSSAIILLDSLTTCVLNVWWKLLVKQMVIKTRKAPYNNQSIDHCPFNNHHTPSLVLSQRGVCPQTSMYYLSRVHHICILPLYFKSWGDVSHQVAVTPCCPQHLHFCGNKRADADHYPFLCVCLFSNVRAL